MRLILAAESISVAVKMVRIWRQDLKTLVWNIATIEIRWRRRDTDTWIGRITIVIFPAATDRNLRCIGESRMDLRRL